MSIPFSNHFGLGVSGITLHCLDISASQNQFICDAAVTKLVEATNEPSLVEAENDIWYDIVRGYGLRRSLFRRKGHFYGTKKQKTSTRRNG